MRFSDMISIRVICVGRLKERFYTDAANEYIKRLSGYCKIEVLEIPESRLSTGSEPSAAASSQGFGTCGFEAISADGIKRSALIIDALDKERAAIEGKLISGARTFAMCVEGHEADSIGLSKILADCAVHGTSRLCFIIGGSNGLHDDIKKKADVMLSMSKMTFPHNLARIMLLEQLYRAFNITEGGKYHK